MQEMFERYVPTHLESAIMDFYRKNKVKSQYDIDLEMFAWDAGIWVHYADMGTTHNEVDGTMYSIIIDNRIPWQQQRVEFAHELGHVLLHAGRQEFMNNDFRALQEWQADRFAMYALAPTCMIVNTITNASSRTQLVRQLAEAFDVPDPFMDVRLKILEQRFRDLQAQGLMQEAIEAEHARYDYTYRHPTNPVIEYLVKDHVIVGQRRRADI
ncbi:ImmA/IrrE family metallo-endopeptidase [Alicyclobacillus dauci]|uniref:ImmA/IrrE family metallo-endopeptidase n=1 Tax=Alicyclobacillus dauci TaxID=1475485 RepID=A0ABY6Z6Q1_9BACL|nr:ImmA/IrrE family metallo-endopeptidase [Alicyclobacillus dauci]WAH38573.1 ImmA/IrrE family metallo-endopeptidase [Alicyclobacillus dauci]